MDREILVTGSKPSLSDGMVEDGRSLLRALDPSGVGISAAVWFYDSELERWVLLVGSEGYDVIGPKRLYEVILSAIENLDGKLALTDIRLLSADHPLIALLRSAIVVSAKDSGVRFTQNSINGVLIEDAFIYRLV